MVAIVKTHETNNAKVSLVMGKHVAECLRRAPDAIDLGVRVIFNESNMTNVQADIFGPVDTPYEGGVFRCNLVIESDFPNSPPKITYLLRIRLLHHQDIPPKGVPKGEILFKYA